jgi:iron complex transport system substrate-binding protein
VETPEPEPRNRPFRRLAPTLRTAVAIFLSLLCTVLDRARALAEEAKPARVVSINMCTDELLLRLADRDRIASVTWLSRDGRNANMAEVAATIPANHGLAEEVVSYHPDLVLAGVYTTRTTVQLLKGIGLKVVEFGVPKTLDGVRQQIRDVAAAVGESARGEAVVAEMDARLDRLAPHAHNPPLNAIVLRPNGFTVGKGSLVNELLERAGLVNLATRLGIDNYLQIPLETVALQQAGILILNGESAGAPSLATETLHHPIVAKLGERLKVISMPSRLWTCAGPSVVDAVELLIERTNPSAVGPTQ